MASEDLIMAAIVTLSVLLLRDVRDIIIATLRIITKPVPKWNKYLGMKKRDYQYNLDSKNRQMWFLITKIFLLIAVLIFDLWMLYATFVPGILMPSEFIRVVVNTEIICCGGLWLLVILGFILHEKFPDWSKHQYDL